MKKISIILLAALMLFAFVACDDTVKVKDSVTLGTGTMKGIQFENPEGVTLSSDNNKDFTVEGTLAEMTEAQAKAFAGLEQTAEIGGWAVGSQFVSLRINAGDDASRVRCGWVSKDDATKATLDDSAFQDKKGEKAIDADYGMILAITNGETVREEVKNNPVWRIEIKNAGSDDVKIFTVDLSAQIAAVDAAE